jgi:hypothetical protein
MFFSVWAVVETFARINYERTLSLIHIQNCHALYSAKWREKGAWRIGHRPYHEGYDTTKLLNNLLPIPTKK